MTEEQGDPAAEELARLAQGGSAAARGALVVRVRALAADHLRRKGCRPQDVEDICQEVLLRVLRGLDGYDSRRPLAAWVTAIADNTAASGARRRAPALLGDRTGEPPDGGPSPVQRACDSERRQAVWRTARRTLSTRQFQALWLHYAGGLGVRDVASRLGLTRTHVKVLLHRARKKLLTCPELRNEV